MQIRNGKSFVAPSLDELDSNIIELLRSNGRATNQEIAEKLSVTPATVSARLRRMEEARVEIRNVRRDAADQLKKEERDGVVGTDEGHRQLEALQRTTDRHIADVDQVGAAKEQEGLEG